MCHSTRQGKTLHFFLEFTTLLLFVKGKKHVMCLLQRFKHNYFKEVTVLGIGTQKLSNNMSKNKTNH